MFTLPLLRSMDDNMLSSRASFQEFVQMGIYMKIKICTPISFIISCRGTYQQHIFQVPFSDSTSMQMPQIAWQYYEREQQAGNAFILAQPNTPPTLNTPPFLANTVREVTNPLVDTTMQPRISFISSFPDGHNIFVVYCGTAPGIHYGW